MPALRGFQSINNALFLVTTVEEGEALLASASKFATWLCACPYQLRNLPAVRTLRTIIMNKEYGPVKNLEVRLLSPDFKLPSNFNLI